jgi:hypothetical protein
MLVWPRDNSTREQYDLGKLWRPSFVLWSTGLDHRAKELRYGSQSDSQNMRDHVIEMPLFRCS